METNYIKLGNCLDLLPELPDASIHAIITDPPFGITNRNTWDQPIDNQALFSQFDRLITPNGVVACFACQPFATDVINAYRKYFRYDIVWRKNPPVGYLNANRMPLRQHESILIFYKSLPTYNPQKTPGKPYKDKGGSGSSNYGVAFDSHAANPTGDRYPTSVIEFSKNRKDKHPTSKPVPLMEWLVKTYTNEGDIVLDPTCGGGSTLVAAAKNNRQYIGFDTSEEYCNISRQRVLNINQTSV